MYRPGLSELAELTVASNAHLGAKLACPPGLLGLPGPQYCLPGPQYCLPGPQYCLSWPPGLLHVPPRALQVPLQSAPTPQNHVPVHTRTQIQQITFCAPQMLLDCLLAPLGAFLGAF